MGLELRIWNQLDFHSKQPSDTRTSSFIGQKEPIIKITSSRYRDFVRPPINSRGLNRRNNRYKDNSNRPKIFNCRNCGQPWDDNHRAKCQAMKLTCHRCNKPNHYAKLCRSNLNHQQSHRLVNEVDNQIIAQLSLGIKMISLDLELHPTYEEFAINYSVKMTGKTDDRSALSKLYIKSWHSKFCAVVDSGSSTSIVTEQIAKDIEARDSNNWWSRKNNLVQLQSYINTPTKNLVTLYCDIVCNVWKARCADIIVVPNKRRTVVGRDIFKTLGTQLKQQDNSNNIRGQEH